MTDILNQYDDLVIQPDRNIDYGSILNRDINVSVKKSDEFVGEYLTDSLNKDEYINLDKYTISEAKRYVNNAVGNVLQETNLDFSKKVVFGISGGGDSNTLLDAFTANGFPEKNLVPVMIHGIPDMDQGTERARIICKEHGLDLIELSPDDINSILGRKIDSSWAEKYERIFQDDLESIATFVIRLGLSKIAKDTNSQAIITGLNLEDVLGEALYLIIKGHNPFAYPVRKIDDVKVMYPLYRVPKKIIDATHPKFSLENYIQRFPSNSHLRALMYFFAQSISSNLPGMEFKLIDGLQKISKQPKLYYDPNIKFPVAGKLDEKTIKLWNQFING